jgi:hypothetical protein
VDTEDEGFHESNLMHSINEFVFGNMPLMKMKKGDKVRWYAMAMGTEVDLHTPPLAGQYGDRHGHEDRRGGSVAREHGGSGHGPR